MQRESRTMDVLHRTFELKAKENLPMSMGLFEKVGAEFAVSGSYVRKILYDRANKDDRELVAAIYGVVLP
jgi:hypothetical protein